MVDKMEQSMGDWMVALMAMMMEGVKDNSMELKLDETKAATTGS